MKKIIAGVLSATLALGCLALPAEVTEKIGSGSIIEASAETYGDFEYDVLEDGTVEITKYIGNDAKEVIPSTINGKKVTSIGEWAFQNSTILTDITIPNSITKIDDFAFYGCTGLTSITIPNNVNSIGSRAFYYCTGLTSITIPSSVTSIGDSVFYYCSSLKKITLPNKIKNIGDFSFFTCTSLISITIPRSVKSVGNLAFYDCTNLKEVYYSGSKAEWDKIKIDPTNTSLQTAKIFYSNGVNVPTLTAKSTYTYTTNAVRINWNKVSGATGYKVFRYNPTTKKWVALKAIYDPNTLTYKDSGLKAGTVYKYRVKAFVKSGGKFYFGKSCDTITTATKPSTPKITKANKTSSAVRLFWNKVTCTGYKIQRYNASTKKWADVKKVSSATTNYKISGLKKNTSYKFRVLAYRYDGKKNVPGAWSYYTVKTAK